MPGLLGENRRIQKVRILQQEKICKNDYDRQELNFDSIGAITCDFDVALGV